MFIVNYIIYKIILLLYINNLKLLNERNYNTTIRKAYPTKDIQKTYPLL